jgi:guanylate kinase
VYGLPLSSLLKNGEGIPVIRPDINGAKTLHKNLPKFGFQPLSIALMPDSWEQIYKILLNEREGSIEEKNSRILEDVENIPLYKDTVNYFLHNSRYKYDGMSGLERCVKGVRYILDNYEG